MSATLRPGSPNWSRHDWFAASGFRKTDHFLGSEAYAQRLARYISDPSTIRVRTIERYGKSPSIAQIAAMRSHWLGMISERANALHTYMAKADPKSLSDETAVVPMFTVDAKADLGEVAPPEPISLRNFGVLPTHRDVVIACGELFGIGYLDIISKSRSRHIVRPRQLACAVLKARGNSYPAIGRWLGGRDHSSTIHGVHIFFDKLMKMPEYEAAWISLAPCAAKFCRTFDEFSAVVGK